MAVLRQALKVTHKFAIFSFKGPENLFTQTSSYYERCGPTYNFLPKLKRFCLFQLRDFGILCFMCALLAGLKWAGLSGIMLMYF